MCRLNGHRLKSKRCYSIQDGDILSFGGAERVTKNGRTMDNPFSFIATELRQRSRSQSRCPSLSFDDSESQQSNGRQTNAAGTHGQSHARDKESDTLLCPICQDLLVIPLALVPCGTCSLLQALQPNPGHVYAQCEKFYALVEILPQCITGGNSELERTKPV
jgi:hypothetical protein